MKRTTPLGWRQRAMLAFIGRHGLSRCYSIHPDENRVARSLERRGILRCIDCGMATHGGRTVLMVTVAP